MVKYYYTKKDLEFNTLVAKFVLSCSLRSHHKTNPTPKMATPYLALPTHHPIENIYEKNRKIDQAETKNETQIF